MRVAYLSGEISFLAMAFKKNRPPSEFLRGGGLTKNGPHGLIWMLGPRVVETFDRIGRIRRYGGVGSSSSLGVDLEVSTAHARRSPSPLRFLSLGLCLSSG